MAAADALTPLHVPESLDGDYRTLMSGIEVGRVHDLTVAWVVEQWENPQATGAHGRHDYRTVCVKQIRDTDFPMAKGLGLQAMRSAAHDGKCAPGHGFG